MTIDYDGFFDQPYYKLNKILMSALGIWPEQSLFMRILINLIHILNVGSVFTVQGIRLVNVWGHGSLVIECITPMFVVVIGFIKSFNGSWNMKKACALLDQIKSHWTRLASTPNTEILNKYGNRGQLITLYYSLYVYASLVVYLAMPLLPVLLDFLIPLDEARPKKLLYDVEYGISQDDYFFEMAFHLSQGTVFTVTMLVAVDTMYFMLVEHACGLFEMVGVNIQMMNKSLDRNVDNDYKKISYCVNLHREALAFAELIESEYSASFMSIIGLSMLAMTISLVQIVLNMGNTEEVIRYGTFVAGQVSHLFFNSIPGQKMIDYSLQVQESVYASDWVDFDTKNQKLIMMVMMRSQKPCRLSAGKIYIMSMESFSSVIQSAMSYFTVLTSMI